MADAARKLEDRAAAMVEQERRTPITGLTLDVFMDMEFPPRQQLLAPWLLSSSINMLTAYRGVGKTWASLSIALAVASGGQFLRWQAERPARVLYIDGEMPASQMQERIKQLLPMFPDFRRENFTLVTPDIQNCALPDLGNLKGQADLTPWTDGADFIVVDNLSALVRTGVENEAESWTVVATWALRMRREGRAVMFVHHAGKSGQQRGTSKREDLLDTSIVLTRPEDAQNGAAFAWEWSKARGLHGNDLEPIQAELVTNSHGRVSWSCRSAGDVRLEQVRQLVADGLTTNQIAAELGVSRSVAGRYAKQVRDSSQASRAYREESRGF